MKIGILTQPLGHNYGGILQNWALQQVIKSLGHSPVTLVYYGTSILVKLKYYIYALLYYLIKYKILHHNRSNTVAPWKRDFKYNLRKFIKKYIITTPYLPNIDDRILRKLKIDAILVGSDQVWRPKYNKNSLDYMFCDFGGELSTLPHSSYAASFGVKDWEFTAEESDKARRAVKRFDKISVRERSGCNLCSEKLGVNATHVLDPTLLLSLETYNELISDRIIKEDAENSVGIYVLDLTSSKKNIIDAICSKINLKPIYFGDRDSRGILKPLEEWLSMFNKCSFIITDSFHGTVFSIIYRKPFISIANESRGTDRFMSLLSIIGLESRLVYEGQNSIVSNILESNIDWDSVSKNLDNYKTISMNFIREVLEL